jgi:hypothetical protein
MARIAFLVSVASGAACGGPDDTCDVLGGPNGEGCHTEPADAPADTDDGGNGGTVPSGPYLTAAVTADNGITPYTFTSDSVFGSMSLTQFVLPVDGDEGGSLTIVGSPTNGSQVVGPPGGLTSFVFDDPAHFGSTGDFRSVSGSLEVGRFEEATAQIGGYGSFADATFDVQLENTQVQPTIRVRLLGSFTSAAVVYNR